MPTPRKRGGATAEDVIREKQERLRTDPEYRAQVQAVEAEQAERVRTLREAEAPVVSDLRRAGVNVASVWDLVNTSEPYPDALPVLMEHLERGGYPDRVMESLGRALAVKPAVAYWERLKALYASPDRQGQQEGLAVALAASATKAQLDDLISFLGWVERGSARIHFLRPIKRLGGDRGRTLLEQLQDDEVFGKEATALLRRSRR